MATLRHMSVEAMLWMRSQPGTILSPALRAGAIILLFVLMLGGATGYSPEDVRASTAEARIDAPANGAQVDGIVEIRGRATVSDGHFSFYRILIGEGSPSISLRPLGPAYDHPIENGVLGTWDTKQFVSGVYTLTLRVYADDNAFASSSTVVTVKLKPTPTPLAIILP